MNKEISTMMDSNNFEENINKKSLEVTEKTVHDMIEIRDNLSPVLCMIDVIQASADSDDLIDKSSIGRVASMVYAELEKIMNRIDESIENAR